MVDDLPANLLALEAILESEGYELVQVSSGAAAIEAVGKQEFAAILLDVHMPVMDGFDTARRIKGMAAGRAVPIIFVTAMSHDTARVRDAYSTGAVDFIQKPLDRDILRAKLRVFVELYQTGAAQRDRERQLRAEADQLASNLETAGKLNEEFVASLGRELRAPLQTIIGWIHTLRSGSVAEPQRVNALDAVERNADAQLELIEEMLDMNNLAAGTLTLVTASVDLAKLVEGVVTGLRPKAASASNALELAIDRDLKPMTGDPERLAQITRQLVSYAVRASSPGGRVAVALMRSGSHVQLTVQDSSDGLDAALLPTIFEGFDEANVPASLRGMGLKLAILRRLVELHSGTVHVESEGRGKGTRFIVRLPAS